ncbi:hypothetical protein GCM10010483_55410 [Actinokineospora diospyrosa]
MSDPVAAARRSNSAATWSSAARARPGSSGPGGGATGGNTGLQPNRATGPVATPGLAPIPRSVLTPPTYASKTTENDLHAGNL